MEWHFIEIILLASQPHIVANMMCKYSSPQHKNSQDFFAAFLVSDATDTDRREEHEIRRCFCIH